MHPITQSNQDNFDVDAFTQKVLQICKEHKKENRAMAFALIIHTSSDPQILKMLRDQDYWNAIDKISGQLLTLFYIDATYVRQEPEEVSMEFLCPVQMQENFLDFTDSFENDVLVKNISTPYILFFQTNGDTIIDSFAVLLKEKIKDKVFEEVKAYLISATDALKRISPDSIRNNGGIFAVMKSNIQSDRLRDKIFNTVTLKFVFRFVSSLAGS